MSVYDRPKASATRMLKKYGQTVTLTNKSAGAYDPATGAASVTTATQTTEGAVFEWGLATIRYGQGYIDQTLINVGDKQLFLSATELTTPPALGDTVTIGSKVYTLVPPLKPLSPAGTVVLYECNIRA